MNLLEKLYHKSVIALALCLALSLTDLVLVWRAYAAMENALDNQYIIVNKFPVKLKRVYHENAIVKKY